MKQSFEQYCTFSRQFDEKEQIGRLRMKVADCKYKETNMHMKEQFINGLNDDSMKTEIVEELRALSDISSVISKQWSAFLPMLIHRQKESKHKGLR